MMSTPGKGKRILPASFTGHKGVLLIDRVVTDLGWLFTPTTAHTDGGVDGFIEIRRNDTNEVTNLILQVQSKATTKDWTAETKESFEFRVSERDIAYWIQGNTPVVLIVSRPETGEAYWVSVKERFKDLAARKSKKVRFDKRADSFSINAGAKLFALAAPVDSGLYSEPLPRSETLESNLLPLTRYPTHLYLAVTELKTPREVNDVLREFSVHPGHEWFLKEGKLFSFHDLNHPVWKRIVDQGSVERFRAQEWSDAVDTDRKRDFVRLLNQSLRSFLAARGVWRFAPKESAPVYYFARGREKVERRESWTGSRSEPVRFVVKGVPAKAEPSRMVCYRHVALRPRFDRFGDRWHLVVDPTYHFTSDGEIPSGYREEYLSGIKRLEKHQAVSNNLRFWVDFLTRQDLFSKPNESLAFGTSLKFQADFGIPETEWLTKADRDTEDVTDSGEVTESQPQLLHEG